MPENIQLISVTMPEFEAIVPEQIYNEATISLGILDQGIPSGVICLYYSEFHYSVTWLYVEEEHRRKGLGTALLEGITRTVSDIEEVYPIQCSFTSTDEELVAFFEANEHFSVHSIGDIYTISKESRCASKLLSNLTITKDTGCVSIFQYEKMKRDRFLMMLKEEAPQMFQYLNQNMDAFEPDLSLAYGTRDIRAAVFCKVQEETIDINILYAKDLVAFSLLVAELAKQIENNYEEYSIRIFGFQKRIKELVRALFVVDEELAFLEANWDMRLPGEYSGYGTD